MRIGGLSLWGLLLAFANSLVWANQNSPNVIDRTFHITIDRSVRNGFGVYSNGKDIVIHLHNNGNTPPQIIDARTGTKWEGDTSVFSAFSQVYDYATALERPDSYLLKLGCAGWKTCTSLEGSDFILMSREGSKPNLIEFRLLDFYPIFSATQTALSGGSVDEPLQLHPSAPIALAEVSRNGWRSRFREAMRSINNSDQIEKLKDSAWLKLLREIDSMAWDDSSRDFPLERDLEIADCRVRWHKIIHQVKPGDFIVAGQLTKVVQDCQDFYVHIIDWLLDLPKPRQNELGTILGKYAQTNRDENMQHLAVFLGFPKYDARPEPSASATSRPRTSVIRRPSAGTPITTPAIRPEMSVWPAASLGAASEWQRIRESVPNKIELLAFTESDGITRPDRNSLAGTVFVATLAGPLSEGRFRIEAFNRPQAPVKMRDGQYRVQIRARLTVLRSDRCTRLIQCLLTKSEELYTDRRVKTVDFQLRPSDFRNLQTISFGPLIPSDYERTGVIQRSLKEVRLVLELADIHLM